MASQLDLQEQEQLDALKSFWKRYGNALTWALTLVLSAYAAWNGWNYYQAQQSTKASFLYDELERSAQGTDTDKIERVFNDLRERYGSTTFAKQGALLAAKALVDRSQGDKAAVPLQWLIDKAGDDPMAGLARLRLSALHLDAGRHEQALSVLAPLKGGDWQALAADRRGDVLLSQGKKAEAAAAFKEAWDQLPEAVEYRRLVEAKLIFLGAAPKPASPGTSS